MPDAGIYARVPRPESIATLIKFLKSKPFVESAETTADQLVTVKRKNKSTLRVFLTNIYVVGDADVAEILATTPRIDAIVTMSTWNSYSSNAKDHARRSGVGLFKFNEFLGAIYRDGPAFIDYVPPERS